MWGSLGDHVRLNMCGPNCNATETVTVWQVVLNNWSGNHWVTMCVEQLWAHGDCHNADQRGVSLFCLFASELEVVVVFSSFVTAVGWIKCRSLGLHEFGIWLT